MPNSSILPIVRNLSGATTPGKSGPGSDSSEGVFSTLQSSSIIDASPLDCLVSYKQDIRWGLELGSYLSAEMKSVYSRVPADWANGICWQCH